MKVLFSTLLFCSVSLGAISQSKMNGHAELLLETLHQTEAAAMSGSNNDAVKKVSGNHNMIDVLVLVENPMSTTSIENLGAKVNWVSGDILGVSLPIMLLEALTELPEVLFVEYTPDIKPTLDFARPSGTVNEAQNGFEFEGSTHSFTGKGVLTGLMDSGIDPNHINFKDSEGNTRVKAVYHYTGQNGAHNTYTTPSSIGSFGTDDSSTYHGTHVAGIMCGSYNGPGTYGLITSPTGKSGKKVTGNIPYYGIAIGSDIAMAAGSFTNNNITDAVKQIFDLAQSMGVPAVVNLSIGHNSGPHDGTDLFATVLAQQAKRGIIAIAAGNEGDVNLFLEQTFTSSTTELKSFLSDNTANGTIDIWGADNTPFKVSVILYATSGGAITEVCSVDSNGGKGSSNGNAKFSTNFSGSVSMTASVNRLNNRFNVAINMSEVKQTKSGMNLGFIISGSNGQSVRVYGSENATFTSNRISGWTNGNAEGSINNMACTKGVIAVGSYTSRTTWPDLLGQVRTYSSNQYSVNEISPFSSWGQTFGGEWLPTVCAPGAAIISSANTYYAKGLAQSNFTAMAENGSTINYWTISQGTSMACPFVAGVVALWLEANPSLTPADIADIISTTSVPQSLGGLPGLGGGDDDSSSKRWGAGKIDAVAGLKEAIKRSDAIENIFADDDMRLIINAVEGGYEVFVAGESSLKADVVDMQGRVVASTEAEGCETVVGTAGIAPGVYVLDIRGASSRFARKIRL